MANPQKTLAGCVLVLLLWQRCTALLDSCPDVSGSLCRVGSLRGHADLLEVRYSGVKVHCDQQLTKAQTAPAPVLRYSKAVNGSEYLFVLNDPDAPFPCAKVFDLDGSYLHALLTMVAGQDGTLTLKTEPVPYHGPNPPQGLHRYMLRLFALPHPPSIDLTLTERRNFKVDQLAATLRLGDPVAVFEVKVAP